MRRPDIQGRRGYPSAGIRLALFLAWSAGVICAWLLRRPFLPRRSWTVAAAGFTRAWSRGVLAILGIRVECAHRPPRPPFLLVTNHLGYLDVAVIAAQVPCTFVSKSEVARWPLFGTLAALSGTLFLRRDSGRDAGRMNGRMAAHFAAGGGLALFPEGTSTGGEGVAPFRSPLLEFPAQAGVPVHYAVLKYRAPAGFPPASLSMCWWGDAPFLPHFLGLFRMRGMAASLDFGPEPETGSDRKVLARRLQSAVEKRLGYPAREARPAPEAAV